MKTYTLMNKNTSVLNFELNTDTNQINTISKRLNPEYSPLGILDIKGTPLIYALSQWWQKRSIPASRSGLRDALEILDIRSPMELLVKCHGLSLSDQYWIKEDGSSLQWKDINFFDNDFSDDVGEALFGRKVSDVLDLLSPNNTSDGWLKKKWKIIDGKRVLLKARSGESLQEPLNEVIVTRILDLSTFTNFIPYSLLSDKDGKPLSLCENFINSNTELITAWDVFHTTKQINSDNTFTHYVKCCEKLGIPNKITEEYLSDMLTLDYLVCNQDRHLHNFGVIRDVNTLKILSHAPLFDNGTSLWNGVATSFIRAIGTQESKPFRKEHNDQIKLVDKSYRFNIWNVDMLVESVMSLSPYVEQGRIEKISTCLSQRFSSFYS